MQTWSKFKIIDRLIKVDSKKKGILKISWKY